MGIKGLIKRAGNKAADTVTKLAVLSPLQLEEMQKHREEYLNQVPSMDDAAAEELTKRLLAASSIDIYNEYLQHIHDLYVPVERSAEYGKDFNPAHNIRFFNVTKWVTDKKENSLEKLVNVYQVLSNEDCNIALVFHRSCEDTKVYLAVVNADNADDNVDVENYRRRLAEAIRGNFPGSEWNDKNGKGIIPCLKNSLPYSVACASNIPGEKSEKFISQTIEKLLDGIVPNTQSKEYTIILLATPINDIGNRKLHLAELYSALAPYAGWSTSFQYTESSGTNSTATFGVNAGVSAGIQQGQNQSTTNTSGTTDTTGSSESNTQGSSTTESTGKSVTDSTGSSTTESTGSSVTDSTGTSTGKTEGTSTSTSNTHTEGSSSEHADNTSRGKSAGGHAGFEAFGGANYEQTLTSAATDSSGTSLSDAIANSTAQNMSSTVTSTSGHSTAETITKAVANTVGQAVATSTGKAIANSAAKTLANTLGHAVSQSVATASGIYKGVNFGGNFGANFARSSNVTATIGKNEGINQSFINFNIKHTLEILEQQMKRYEQSTALGMWDFAAYVLSEDQNVASNVAHSYLALTQGEESYMSQTAVNLWRGDMGENSKDAAEICNYLRELRHPMFGLNPALTTLDAEVNAYPAVITAATALSGKELAYSLNFPQKSVAGFPVIECAEFGRNVVTYQDDDKKAGLRIGNIHHMNHLENANVILNKDSLCSHVFITGSTGSGKSNTVYRIIDEANEVGAKFLVIEPAKGEYKDVFGSYSDISVYGTNPKLTPLLRMNPFSFPNNIHVLEHIDRLVEIFNVCWPMYAAMPAVLKNAVEKAYEDCGWNLLESENSYGEGLYPSFSDVARNIKTIIDSSEYDAENKGAYKGSLLTRLQSLTIGLFGMIFTADEIQANKLFDENVIIDLSRIGSSETKSLLMGVIILKLQEYRSTQDIVRNSELRHITVLEEAHNILRKTPTEVASEAGNLAGKSVEMISNAIAEMRTYGEGFVIVDQAPGLLDMASIRNTNTKIIMRLPDQTDRELVGHAAGLNDEQISELAKLPCGVAAIYQNEWIQPVLCKIDKYTPAIRKYVYQKTSPAPVDNDTDDRLKLAEMLSGGERVELDRLKDEIIPLMDKMKLGAAVQVAILRMLQNPPKEPRMTKIAPIMAELFPAVKLSVKNSYADAGKPEEWTKAAETALFNIIRDNTEEQVRRDIIQGIITYYLYYELNNVALLEQWSKDGGLR